MWRKAIGDYPRPMMTRVAALVRAQWTDTAIILLLAFFCLGVRMLSLEPIEVRGGDARDCWFLTKTWLWGVRDVLEIRTHHDARWAMNLPVYWVQRFIGTHPVFYYVAPVTAAVVQSMFTYKLGQHLGGRAVGVIATMILVTFPPMARTGSQLLPGIFEGTYLVIAVYFLVLSVKTPQRARWTALAAVALFLAYQAKISNVLFGPGFVCAIWWAQRDRRNVVLFVCTFLALVFLETAFYVVFTDFWSQFHLTVAVHGAKMEKHAVYSLWRLIGRYTELDGGWGNLFYFFLASSLAILAWHPDEDRAHRSVLVVVLSFLLCLGVAVKSIDPVVPWSRPVPRYLDVVVPILSVVSATFLVWASRVLWTKVRSNRWIDRKGYFQQYPVVVVMLVLAVCTIRERDKYVDNLKNHPVVETSRLYELINDSYARNLPIASEGSGAIVALEAVHHLFLGDEYILRDGKVMSLDKRQKLTKRTHWLAQDPVRYRKRARQQVKEGSCAVLVSMKARFMEVTPSQLSSLPAACSAGPKPGSPSSGSKSRRD